MRLHVLCWMRWLWGQSDVALISAVCTDALQIPCLCTHTPGQLAHVSAATIGSVYTIFRTFLVFGANFVSFGFSKVRKPQDQIRVA